eukprot:CAMPEP_0174840606 /NCGR_PEP_ID=MMETSP1114-20130205/8786_1 /TAXON_ID=312471 /ORGANISM="Neobodo designis, Strain CCAP 1951/1" /LENGTH=122 /DNA_ID=CAMNT_0016074763 /DNA_START=37 /DNA_END=405 /DNA_ORIENTATION=+
MSYTTGLCDCMQDTSSCVDSVICYPCMIGRQCGAADGQSDQCSCFGCICGYLFPSLSACCLRKKLAERYSLEEGCCGQVIFGCLCPACSLCQTHREFTIRGVWPGGSCIHKQPGEFNNAPIQ